MTITAEIERALRDVLLEIADETGDLDGIDEATVIGIVDTWWLPKVLAALRAADK